MFGLLGTSILLATITLKGEKHGKQCPDGLRTNAWR
jgi:hypothetical protein